MASKRLLNPQLAHMPPGSSPEVIHLGELRPVLRTLLQSRLSEILVQMRSPESWSSLTLITIEYLEVLISLVLQFAPTTRAPQVTPVKQIDGPDYRVSTGKPVTSTISWFAVRITSR